MASCSNTPTCSTPILYDRPNKPQMYKRLQIRHSCITNHKYMLVSHQTEPENYAPLVCSIINSIDVNGNRKLTFPVDKFQVHVLVDNSLVFCCVTYKTDQCYMPFTFLETVRTQFGNIPGLVSRAYNARELEFDRDFGPVLASTVYEFNIGRGDKLSELQIEIDDVKQIMLENVEKVIQRGENLDELLNKTENLDSVSGVFRQRTRDIYRKAKCKNLEMWLIIGTILGILLTVATLLAFGVIHL